MSKGQFCSVSSASSGSSAALKPGTDFMNISHKKTETCPVDCVSCLVTGFGRIHELHEPCGFHPTPPAKNGCSAKEFQKVSKKFRLRVSSLECLEMTHLVQGISSRVVQHNLGEIRQPCPYDEQVLSIEPR